MPAHETVDQNWIAFRRQALRRSPRQIGPEAGCTGMGVSVVLREHQKGPARPDRWSLSAWRLHLADREETSLGLLAGQSRCSIARSASTVCRAVAAKVERPQYRARRAQRRPTPHKLRRARFCAQVNRWLGNFWSPEQVVRRLRLEFPDDPSMWASYETIFQSLFAQGRGESRRELARALRSGQVGRRPMVASGRAGKYPTW
jgi:IS30 family transposase